MRFRCVNILAVLFFFLGFSSVAYSDEVKDGIAAYERGEFAVAIKKFRKLAEQRNAIAQSFLGGMYYNGEGVPQDYVLAYMWVNLAVYSGFQSAVEFRDAVSKKMTPKQIEKAQILTREWLEKNGK